MKKEIRKGKGNVTNLIERPFTLKNTMPASKLRKISQKKLKEMIDENHILGLIIKDKMEITMLGMEEFEQLREYIEILEQTLEEALMVSDLGTEHFEMPKEEFIKMPENMTASQYREWRKGTVD